MTCPDPTPSLKGTVAEFDYGPDDNPHEHARHMVEKLESEAQRQLAVLKNERKSLALRLQSIDNGIMELERFLDRRDEAD